jgi:PTH2 family peptidyl-tRNA hydrolase
MENPTKNIKQVIVIRRDLKMRRGKESAQIAHASMKFLLDAVVIAIDKKICVQDYLTEEALIWLNDIFTKVVVSVNSLEELQDIEAKAINAGLMVKTIIDVGKTEFHGESTMTCIAIGPNYADEIDKVTGHLKLR